MRRSAWAPAGMGVLKRLLLEGKRTIMRSSWDGGGGGGTQLCDDGALRALGLWSMGEVPIEVRSRVASRIAFRILASLGLYT